MIVFVAFTFLGLSSQPLTLQWGFYCRLTLERKHFENGQASICWCIPPFFKMFHPQQQCNGCHQLHDKDEVVQYVFQDISL